MVRLSEGSMILCRLSSGKRREGGLEERVLNLGFQRRSRARATLDARDRNIRVADPCAVARDGIAGKYCDLFEHLWTDRTLRSVNQKVRGYEKEPHTALSRTEAPDYKRLTHLLMQPHGHSQAT